MPLIAITDIMDKHRQEKERQEKSSSVAEPAGGTQNNNDSSHADSKLKYTDDGPAPMFHSHLSEKLKRLSVIDTGVVYREADVHPEHKIEESTKSKTSAFDITLAQRNSSGDDPIRAQLPHRPKAHSHTKEDTTIEELAIAGMTI
ncbi:hypothetical protein DTO027B5_2928 [Paecilomyces variotii]|nr:hypothetical protein DTO027B3_6061 [Paecilomyces variotii]KAJ9335232.1 hypothetical protein DTO027B5_2928 [Paecilomyces variotii]